MKIQISLSLSDVERARLPVLSVAETLKLPEFKDLKSTFKLRIKNSKLISMLPLVAKSAWPVGWKQVFSQNRRNQLIVLKQSTLLVHLTYHTSTEAYFGVSIVNN